MNNDSKGEHSCKKENKQVVDKTKYERNKQLEFLRAYSNPETRFSAFVNDRHSGKTFFKNLILQVARLIKGNKQGKRSFKSCMNYLVQEQNAHKQLNLMLQANFADIEIRAISKAIKDGTFPDITIDSPTVRIPTVKIFNGGGYYSATCPKCRKIKILSSELNTMSAVCNKCYTAFKLVK